MDTCQEGPDGRITSTDHWAVVPDRLDPDDRSKDTWQPKAEGGYQTLEQPANLGDIKALNAWIHDTREWGLMMHEAVLELRERVERLETLLQEKSR
jgi:hypothetical protein